MSRTCNTVIRKGPNRSVSFHSLDLGTAFIRMNPTQANNPCVYYKCSNNKAAHQSGMGQNCQMDAAQLVIPVRVVETHIEILS